MVGTWGYKGNLYRIISEGRMKHPITREWISCIIYQRFTNDAEVDKSWHCRDVNDFLEKFKKIK